MLGAPFDNVAFRIRYRIELFSNIFDEFYLLIDKMPSSDLLSNPLNKENITVTDIKIQIPNKDMSKSCMERILCLIKIQIKMILNLFNNRKNIDTVIFATGIPFILPVLMTSKILGMKSIIMAGGTAYKNANVNNSSGPLYTRFLWLLEMICYQLSTNIAAETKSVIQYLGLSRFEQKILLLGSLIYVDTNIFNIKTMLKYRKNVVGYIGCLNYGKGILSFIDAIKIVSQCDNNIEFIIVGDGPLFQQVYYFLESEKLLQKVKLVKWVSRDEVARYLNKIKLLVLPSYNEGLPGIILEAMACGTPVAATPVGGIPDIIKNGKTGFILENNSPECIANNILDGLHHPHLANIVKNAHMLIENQFTFDKELIKWKKALAK
jgi:glycosyltransferase involved in cell wall biosynthesis